MDDSLHMREDEFVDLLMPIVNRIVRKAWSKLCSSDVHAEKDVRQDVWVELWTIYRKHTSGVKPIAGDIMPYLVGAAKRATRHSIFHLLHPNWRREGQDSHPPIPFDPTDQEMIAAIDKQIDEINGIAEEIEEGMFRGNLAAALDRLPEAQRRKVVSMYWGDGATRNRTYYRALQNLREYLTEE